MKPAVIMVKTPLKLVVNPVLENYVHARLGCVADTAPQTNTVVVIVPHAVQIVLENFAYLTTIAHRAKPVVHMRAVRFVFIYRRVKMMKIAPQVNLVLKLAECVPKRALRMRVTKMVIAPLGNVVATTGHVHLGHATQERKVIILHG